MLVAAEKEGISVRNRWRMGGSGMGKQMNTAPWKSLRCPDFPKVIRQQGASRWVMSGGQHEKWVLDSRASDAGKFIWVLGAGVGVMRKKGKPGRGLVVL